LENLLKKCLLNKKQVCSPKCHATKRCFTVFKKKKRNCGHCKNCTVAKVKCVIGKQCVKECVWKKFTHCFSKRLPNRYVGGCTKIFFNVKFKSCVTGCVHIKSWGHCWENCTKGRIDHHHHHCKRELVKHGFNKKKHALLKKLQNNVLNNVNISQ